MIPVSYYLAVGAGLFVLGLIGFLARRNLIVMFLCAELMLQGVALNFVAFSRHHGNLHGQVFTLFVVTVAACEAGIALALILMLYRRKKSLDVSVWQELREQGLEPMADTEPLPTAPPEEPLPKLPPPGSSRFVRRSVRMPELELEDLLWFIPLFPLAGAVGCGLLGGRFKRISHLPCVLGAALSLAVSVLILVMMLMTAPQGAAFSLSSPTATWFFVGSFSVKAVLTIDPISAVMLLVITFVGTCIVIFSIGYMEGEEGYTRYFAIVSLFLFSMILLVMADNFLLLFVGWEGVGLCSYLLIGYWYAKPSAAAAARKAFLVTRLGDVGLLLGIFLLWSIGGHKLDFASLFILEKPSENRLQIEQLIKERGQSDELLTVICLLIFCGAVGKSAQFPLYVWLPDAMEGPTPISALIHAATMVTAGVYLLARCMPLFVRCPEAQLVVACIGAFTALLAAYIALTQNDLKRVLAYSTVSQLGYMFLALGTAGPTLALVAVTAAMFHLFTHAFFKAVLFLSAGSVMHGMGNVIDMRKFGGLRKVMPVTHLTFLCGAAALAGLPLLSGFWSKDAIFEAVLEANHAGGAYAPVYLVLFLVALFTAALTAFYTFRAYFKTFWGPTRIPAEAGEHAHESPAVMTTPLIVLAIGALFIGLAVEPITHWFSDFLGRSDKLLQASQIKRVEQQHLNWPLMIGSSAVAILAAGAAWWLYQSKPETADVVARKFPRWYSASLNRLYMDEIFNVLFVQPLRLLSFICKAVESLIFDIVRLIASIPRGLADVIRPLQNGLVQFYALTTALGVAVFIAYLVFFAK